MLRLIATYLATAISFAAVDYVWLTQLSTKVYRYSTWPISWASWSWWSGPTAMSRS